MPASPKRPLPSHSSLPKSSNMPQGSKWSAPRNSCFENPVAANYGSLYTHEHIIALSRTVRESRSPAPPTEIRNPYIQAHITELSPINAVDYHSYKAIGFNHLHPHHMLISHLSRPKRKKRKLKASRPALFPCSQATPATSSVLRLQDCGPAR